MVSSISPNLFDSAIRRSPRRRDCTFSSVRSGAWPWNSGASVSSTAATPPAMGSVSSLQPSARATAAASSSEACEVKREGSITQRTFAGPMASDAMAATMALSTPPDRPSSTARNPVLAR